MRMWMIEPAWLCQKHLLGEHVEIHMLVGALQKHKSIAGFLQRGLLEPRLAEARHEALAKEMVDRGMKHQSELSTVDVSGFGTGYVDTSQSCHDLIARCPACRARIQQAGQIEMLMTRPSTSVSG